MTDLVEDVARAIIRAEGAHIVADDENWPPTIKHFRQMEAEHGERYTSGRSLVTDAMREARIAIATIKAAGLAIVPKIMDWRATLGLKGEVTMEIVETAYNGLARAFIARTAKNGASLVELDRAIALARIELAASPKVKP